MWALAFGNDSRLLASGGDREIILWDASLEEACVHARRVIRMHCDHWHFSSDNRRLLSASRDKSVKLWDVESGALLMTKKEPHSSITTAALFLNAPGRLRPLASRAHSQYGPFRMTCPAVRWSFPAGSETGTRRLCLGSFSRRTENCSQQQIGAELFTSGTSKLLAGGCGERNNEHPLWIHALCFSPDGNTLLVSCGDKTLRFWDVATQQQKSFSLPGLACLEFSPDGRTLAGGGRIWACRAHSSHRVMSLSFSHRVIAGSFTVSHRGGFDGHQPSRRMASPSETPDAK